MRTPAKRDPSLWKQPSALQKPTRDASSSVQQYRRPAPARSTTSADPIMVSHSKVLVPCSSCTYLKMMLVTIRLKYHAWLSPRNLTLTSQQIHEYVYIYIHAYMQPYVYIHHTYMHAYMRIRSTCMYARLYVYIFTYVLSGHSIQKATLAWTLGVRWLRSSTYVSDMDHGVHVEPPQIELVPVAI